MKKSTFALIGSISITTLIVQANPNDEIQSKTKIVLGTGTEKDAEEALSIVKQFLDKWESKDYDAAIEFVYEPIRKDFKKEITKKSMKLQSIDEIKLIKNKNIIRARVDVSADPDPRRPDLTKRQFMVDMFYLNGKWWVAAR